MIAIANEVAGKIYKQQAAFEEFFTGNEMIVPPCSQADNNLHYHSIIGTKLLYVDWEKTHGIQVPCPAGCNAVLSNVRTNFSKNKTLFPIFGWDGCPIWCIVMKLQCPSCRRKFYSNEGDALINMPACAANTYPVETNYALGKSLCHLNRHATETFVSIMVICGNGELCSKLLFNTLNRDYIQRIKSYYSMQKEATNGSTTTTPKCLDKDGEFIRQCPPMGDTIRDLYDDAASSSTNPWRLSDHDRHVREMQSVKCTGIFCQDHAYQVCKNYGKKLGAVAAWDVPTGTGEIASAALVRSTRTEDFAHAAQQMVKRKGWTTTVKHSDTWPNKKEFWQLICPGIEGRLGLFHYQQRIISTLRKKHVDYFQAVTDLLAALYVYCSEDYENRLSALKDGTLSRKGKKYSSEEMSDMKRSKIFRDR